MLSSDGTCIVDIRRIDNHPASRRREKPREIVIEHLVFDEVVEHIERKARFGLLAAVVPDEAKLFRRIVREQRAAAFDRRGADVETEVALHDEIPELTAVAEAEVDH